VHAAISNSVQPSALQFWPFSTAISFQMMLKLKSICEVAARGQCHMHHAPSRGHVCVNPSGSVATTKADLQIRVEGFEKLSLQ